MIYNRADCCWERLNGFKLTVGGNPPKNDTDNPTCGGRKVVTKNNLVINVICPTPLTGRYVKLQSGSNSTLHVCEVEVMGHPKNFAGEF